MNLKSILCGSDTFSTVAKEISEAIYSSSNEKSYPYGDDIHTKDIYASIAAVSIGAEIIEKHVKLDDEKSIDSQFAIDTSDLKKLVDGCNKAYLSIGKKFYGPTNSEIGAYRRRRSLFYSKNLDKNTRLKKDHVSRKRPGMGLKIKFLNKIIGKKIKKRVNLGSPIKLSDFKIHI